MFNEMNGNKKTVREGIDTRAMDFAPLKDFCGREFVVDGYFFTNGRYGKHRYERKPERGYGFLPPVRRL